MYSSLNLIILILRSQSSIFQQTKESARNFLRS